MATFTLASTGTTAWMCPFCDEEIARSEFPALLSETVRVEAACRDHFSNRHPIRRRLRGDLRRAFRQSEAAAG